MSIEYSRQTHKIEGVHRTLRKEMAEVDGTEISEISREVGRASAFLRDW
jgi:hypothetical protein